MRILYFVLVVQSEAYRTQYKIHELQRKMLFRVNLADVCQVDMEMGFLKSRVEIKPVNEVFKLFYVGSLQWNVIEQEPDGDFFMLRIRILQAESMLDELIIQQGILFLFLFLGQPFRHELVIAKEDANFDEAKLQQVEYEVNKQFVFLKIVLVHLLPLYFFILQCQFLYFELAHPDNILHVIGINEDATIEIGIIRSAFVAFV